jgi:hypothetical protein
MQKLLYIEYFGTFSVDIKAAPFFISLASFKRSKYWDMESLNTQSPDAVTILVTSGCACKHLLYDFPTDKIEVGMDKQTAWLLKANKSSISLINIILLVAAVLSSFSFL